MPFVHPGERSSAERWDAGTAGPYGQDEYFHLNYVDVLPPNPHQGKAKAFAPGNLLLSFPLFQMLLILDPVTYEILWRHYLDPRRSLHGQHCAHMLPNGNILMFVNALIDDLGGTHSSVVEVDPTTHQTVWQYAGSPGETYYSMQTGCAVRLPGGDTLISVGAPIPRSQAPYLLRVGRDGALLGRFEVQAGSSFYAEVPADARFLGRIDWVPAAYLEGHLPLSAGTPPPP